MHLIGAEFVAMFETASDFHDPNFHKVWNSMIVGEVVTIPRLQNEPAQFRWTAPCAHAGNSPFRWPDDQGALKRRLAIYNFKPIAPDQVNTTLLANVKRTEMVMIIAKCNRAYRALVREVDKSSFHSYLSAACPRIAAAGERVSYENSTVQQYMEACFIPADAASPTFSKTAVTIAEFNRSYSQWVSFTKPNASAKNVTPSILEAETAQYARVKNRPDINVRIIPRAEGRKSIGHKKSDCFVIGVTLRSYFDADKPDAGDTI
jgi:hypothetical protein